MTAYLMQFMDKRLALLSLVGLAVVLAAASAPAGGESIERKGADTIELESGRLPAVTFPHRLHQETAEGCSVCHDMYPKERGAIQDLKAKGKLARQAVMKRNCIDCHKERSAAGKPSGPLSCTDCHAR